MDKKSFENLFYKLIYNDKKNVLKEKEFSLTDVNKVTKFMDRILEDLKKIDIIEKREDILYSVYSCLINDNKKIKINKNKNYSFSEKSVLDQSPEKMKELSILRLKRMFSNDNKEIEKIERNIRITEKIIENSIKKGVLFQDSSDFKLMANTLLKEPIHKKPTYIQKIEKSAIVNPIDYYSSNEDSYILNVKLIDKKNLAETKKTLSRDEYIEKYKENYFLVSIQNFDEIPKSFDLCVVDTIFVDFEKIPEFKKIFKEKEIENNAFDMTR